ncbi:hypothetical protein [Luteimonas abyssi]|uniref:hypothetical protein n=1 Tax=Luteimonas abyssi TaxID=1247514 RepID=UPI0012F92C4E|nr:hypothetical protein [Luteimonas abyssi]
MEIPFLARSRTGCPPRAARFRVRVTHAEDAAAKDRVARPARHPDDHEPESFR